jgi:hypothetical protein
MPILKYSRPIYWTYKGETEECHETDTQSGSQIRLIPSDANRQRFRFKGVYGNFCSVYRFGVRSIHVVNRENISGTQPIHDDEKS